MLDIEKFADTGQLFDNHYKLIRPLNTEGGTADVWLALDTTTVSDKEALDKAPYLDDAKLSELGLLVAIKIYKPKNALDIEGERRFREEFVIVFNCNHANLIHPVYFSIFEETPYLVLPYCQRGSSELLIGSFMNDDDLWRYIHDVAAGLNYLHHCNPPIIHQDIKPANVLIDDSGNYAITDFGISAKRYKGVRGNQDDDDYEEQSGTYAYMAPERFIDGNIPSAESDIWAFGATLYELLTGRVPFGEDGGLVQSDDKVSLPFKGIKISKDLKLLICACLSKDPSKRPTAEQLLNATNQKRFKLAKKSNSIGMILAFFCVCAIVGLVIWKLIPQPSLNDIPKPDQKVTTFEERYKEAMVFVDASTMDSVRTGIEKLNILAVNNFAPAQIELAKIEFNQAEEEFQSVADNFKNLHDTLAIDILHHYDKALQWASRAKNDSLMNEYRHCHDRFANYVISKYDEWIGYGQDYNEQEIEKKFTQFKKAFQDAVNQCQH